MSKSKSIIAVSIRKEALEDHHHRESEALAWLLKEKVLLVDTDLLRLPDLSLGKSLPG